MKPPSTHTGAAQPVFMSSIALLANVVAFIVTIFGTPLLYNQTIKFVQIFVFEQYGAGFQDIVILVWGGVCGLIVFAFARASIATALVMGGAAIATRLLI